MLWHWLQHFWFDFWPAHRVTCVVVGKGVFHSTICTFHH